MLIYVRLGLVSDCWFILVENIDTKICDTTQGPVVVIL